VKPTLLTWALVAAVIVVAGVGAVDTARSSQGDLFACFVVLGLIGVVLAVRLVVGRPTITLRADLVRWLAARSQLSGEPLARVADRAVATYRASLEGSDLDGAADPRDAREPGRGTGSG
jgi:hypothetical protein